MKTVLLPRSIVGLLDRMMVCAITGRLMQPGETIYFLPREKREFTLPYFSSRGLLFLHFKFLLFRPKIDLELYEKQNKAMCLISLMSNIE
jgi:hypothetical protein